MYCPLFERRICTGVVESILFSLEGEKKERTKERKNERKNEKNERTKEKNERTKERK
jgi:hypothetical protein